VIEETRVRSGGLSPEEEHPQAELFPNLDDELPKLKYGVEPGMTIQQAFEDFHRRNPHVFSYMRVRALRWKRAGHQRCSTSMLVENLRWDYGVKTTHGGTEFKINNNFKSRYARLLVELEPELDGMFETRKLRAP